MFFVNLIKSKWMHISVLVLLTVIVYGNSIHVNFIADDFWLVYISQDYNILNALTMPPQLWGGFYRPMHVLFYRFGYLVSGHNPISYHIISVGIHVGVALLLYWFILSLGQSSLEAILAALLFAVSPIHTNAVSWLAGVEDSLVALWLLLCVICYVWLSRTPSHARLLFLFSIISFCLALLSQESAVVIPMLLVVYEVFVRRQRLAEWRTWGSRLVLYILLDILYYGYSRGILGARGIDFGKSGASYVLDLNIVRNVAYFGLNLFSPVDLYPFLNHFEKMNMAFMEFTPTSVLVIAFGVVVIIFITGLSWWWHRMSHVTKSWLIWTLLLLSPVLMLSHVSELYLYLPSLGASALIAILATHIYRTLSCSAIKWLKVVPVAAVLAVVVLYSLSTIHRNQVYLQVGNTGEAIITQVREIHPSVPDGSQLYFANEPNVGRGLSVMGLRGVEVFESYAISYAMKIAYQNDSINATLLKFEDMFAMLKQADCYRPNSYFFVWTEKQLVERTCESSDK